jgi:glycosidase
MKTQKKHLKHKKMGKRALYFVLMCTFILLSCQKKPVTTEMTAFENPPAWTKKAIWYQIFVERFRNGDVHNDPTPKDIIGAYPGFVPEGWAITPWTHDWYAPDPYFSELNQYKDFWGNNLTTFGSKAQLRRYGGDLQGVLDKVEYLDSLGVTAIYFNPLNDSPSLHKYDPRYWRHIDHNFGPHPEKDLELMAKEDPKDPSTWVMTSADSLFVHLIDVFHQHDIKVILDYSWNHTGNTFWAWQDVLKNQAKSDYKDWYWVESFDDPSTPKNEFAYRGWAGSKTLPEIKETVKQSTHVVKAFEGNIYSQDVKQHIFNIAKRWLDPNQDGSPEDGIDGYRLDVAAEVPLGFWRDFRKEVRKINPEAYLVGELWWEEWPDKLLDPAVYLKGDIFDAPMNYRWYRTARRFFSITPKSLNASQFVAQLKELNKGIRRDNQYAMMNCGATHDAPRMLTSLYNHNKYKYNCTPTSENPYKVNRPDKATYETLRMLLLQQFTYVGAPHIWAGDEMGMWGSDDPSTRKPLIWDDMNFEDEKVHPFSKETIIDKVKFNYELFDYYRQLCHMRQKYDVLSTGEIEFLLADDENSTVAYSRYNTNEEIIVIFNCSEKEQEIQLPVKRNTLYRKGFQKEELRPQGQKISLILPARKATFIVAE